MGTKKHLDFSTDELADFNFDELVRELHGKPLYVKPQLGTVPNFDIKTPVAPALAEDPVIKAMRVVMRVYEAETGSSSSILSQSLITEARRSGMSRSYFEQILQLLLDQDLVTTHENRYGFYYLTNTGRDFAVSRGLDQF